ncbi:glycosyltransferase family 2 protein [Faecalibacter bovis]|uniref:Glycosyltransferase family 2 protein n=1 Tax=Faecalibacter bovis TaxID=2898187 RepID=A0ABX7XBC9_9FLAO|nr:glycosyltransferase family 2 protein [Faecalibacter bovis]QTV05204.1 glycosyltransferase family 2 protein [Faecalibacter bovis]
MLDLSIVTINFNTSNATIACVKSIIEKTTLLNYEIVVIDNASERDDYLNLENEIKNLNLENLKLVRSNLNTGFGTGNMIGYAETSPSKYVTFINNDVELIDDCFSVLKQYLDQNPDVGVVSPQSVNEQLDFVPTIDHFASWQREIFTRKILEIVNPKRFPKRKKSYTKPIEADFIAGSFMFLRREDFDTIGGFDQNIFLYYEETDLSRRLKAIGKKTVLIPTIQYKHFHGLSTKKSIAIKLEQKLSLIYVVNKHQGWLASKVLLIYFGIKYFFSTLVSPKKWPLFKATLVGMPMFLSLKHKQKIKEI